MSLKPCHPSPLGAIKRSLRTENLRRWSRRLNANTEPEQHERLDVRLMVAESESISDSIVRGLLKATPPAEQNQTVLTLLRNASLSAEMAGEVSELLDADSLWRIASLHTMPPALLRTWSKHESAPVRRAVASNPNTPLEVLEELALDSALAVRDAVLANPDATDEIRALISLQG